MWRLEILHNGRVLSLSVEDDRNLLAQMREQLSLPLRDACKNGVCTICRCQLVSGRISYGLRQAHGLWQREIDEGVILPCIALAESDLVIANLSLV